MHHGKLGRNNEMFDMNFYRGKKVFVTGHTGFKGSWLCKILANAGAEVTGYSLNPPTNPSLVEIAGIDKDINSIIGDIRDYDSLKAVFDDAQPEIVLHLAAQPIVRDSYKDPHYTYETNVMGTVNILECVRQSDCVKSVLNVTTDKVYHNNEWEWGYRENEPLDGFDPYSNSKSCSELVTHSYKNSFFTDNTIAVSTARAGNVIGGGDFANDRIIPDCVRAMASGNVIGVRNPYSTRPYQHVLICFIQDIESYRYNPNNKGSLISDIHFLNNFDVVIAHNQGMIKFLRENGLHADIVNWEVCDYLIDEARSKHTIAGGYQICFVGDLKRSGFLYVNCHDFQTHINLYGQANADKVLTSQLSYNGIYAPDDKTSMLNGHFGLIWEGNCLDTCDGALGNYMKINNPNRLSLYLANNLPVITWKNAGLAKFVEENKIGFTVDALTEVDGILSNMSTEQYNEMIENVKSIGTKIRKGFYAKKAIEEAIYGKYSSI